MHPRDTRIDVAKGLLVVGMVLAHVIQLLLKNPEPLALASDGANIASFSGFLFCFGFAAWLAYWSKENIRWAAMLRTAFKCYAAFAISGVAFKVLVAGARLDMELVRRVVLLRDIPGYSEFLLAFPLALIGGTVALPLVKLATRGFKSLVLASVACLATTLISHPPGRDPLLGLWIGGVEFAYFPVLPYGPLFLAGVYAARHGLRQGWVSLGLAAAIAAAGFYAQRHGVPARRFPPSAFWVIQSFAVFYLYLGVAGLISTSRLHRLSNGLMAIGRHVLLYLVCSNLAIFALHHFYGGRTMKTPRGIWNYIAIMAACWALHTAVDFVSRQRRPAVQP